MLLTEEDIESKNYLIFYLFSYSHNFMPFKLDIETHTAILSLPNGNK